MRSCDWPLCLHHGKIVQHRKQKAMQDVIANEATFGQFSGRALKIKLHSLPPSHISSRVNFAPSAWRIVRHSFA